MFKAEMKRLRSVKRWDWQKIQKAENKLVGRVRRAAKASISARAVRGMSAKLEDSLRQGWKPLSVGLRNTNASAIGRRQNDEDKTQVENGKIFYCV